MCAAFPERQIFVRTDGRVRYFVFGPLHQIIMSGFGLLLVGWVAYTSINVIVQDRVITTEHRRLRQVQMLYDARNAAIDDFEVQQNALAAIIERNEKVVSALRFGASHPGANSTRAALPLGGYRLDNRFRGADHREGPTGPRRLRQPLAVAGAANRAASHRRRRASGPKFRGTTTRRSTASTRKLPAQRGQPLCWILAPGIRGRRHRR